jgi:hypothetical protein
MAVKYIEKPASINIYSYVGDTQGCGTIRIIFPHLLLPHLKTNGYRFVGFYSAYFVDDMRFYKNYTFVQFQRAATETHLKLLKHFKSNIGRYSKTPLIYEVDDLLIGIPEWNYACGYYKAYEKYVSEMLTIVDGITVSTDKLKEVLSQYNKNIEVIPNHLPKFMWGEINPVHLNEPNVLKPRILWAGSSNHFSIKQGIKGGDFGDELLNFIRKTVDQYQWVIMGGAPQELKDLNTKIEFHRWQNIFDYPRYIKSLKADFAVAPLIPGVFNECKSNIKMLEYTASGIPGIYSKIEPYKKAHLQGDSDCEIIEHIQSLAKDVDLRAQAFKKDYEAVKDLLWWEDNNYQNLRLYVNSYLNLFERKLRW